MRTIAIVGLSNTPKRPSAAVAEFMKRVGYRIIPINPGEKTVMGEKSYPTLSAVPDQIDLVDVFRTNEAVPGILAEMQQLGLKDAWLQEGVTCDAVPKGMRVIQDKCLAKEYQRLFA
ncbi:MAG: CoA-binding protein [Acidobacteria bacterium]|nr:CoA-binding protein [Acidobacteriota bacterium]